MDKFPTLVLLPGGSAVGVVYPGKLERDSMFQFLSRFASTKGSNDEPLEPKPKEPSIHAYHGVNVSEIQIGQDKG